MVPEYWGQAPHPTLTAVGVTWLYGFDFEIKVIAKLPRPARAEAAAGGSAFLTGRAASGGPYPYPCFPSFLYNASRATIRLLSSASRITWARAT